MSRFVAGALSIVCLLVLTQWVAAQGPIRNLINETQLQRADYPGPISYAPSDQDTRSKRLRLQTGHYGMFYNCDNEECKRNSPYICWNSQHKADWYCGWKAAWRKDRNDIVQRLLDGSCQSCDCQDCAGGQASPIHVAPQQYGQVDPATQPQSQNGLLAKLNRAKAEREEAQREVEALSAKVASAKANGQSRTVINAGVLGNRNTQAQPAQQHQARRKGLFRIR